MKAHRSSLALGFAALLVLGSLNSCNRGRTVEAASEDFSPTVLPGEQDFMMKAAQANLSEIDIARFAIAKSTNSEVRNYANMIQSDNPRALVDLTDLMKTKHVSGPNTLPAQTQQDIMRMNALSGAEFDREFVNMMVADQQKAVELFRDQSTTAQDSDLKKYIDDVLPKLDMHLEKAHRLQSRLFGGSK
jgi:putative membrane protein